MSYVNSSLHSCLQLLNLSINTRIRRYNIDYESEIEYGNTSLDDILPVKFPRIKLLKDNISKNKLIRRK